MKKLFNLLFISMMAVICFSCSNNDDPELTYTDVEAQYEYIAKTLYTSDGQPAFTLTQTAGQYVAAAENRNVAFNFIEKMIGNDWDGKDVKIDLEEYGYVNVIGASEELLSEGIYNRLIINLRGYEPYTLTIIDKAKASEDNGYTGTGVITITGQ